jgi:hypothetical protein
MVARLKQEGDIFSFRTVREERLAADRAGKPNCGAHGRVVFIPEGLKGGEELVVRWVDTRSACMHLADRSKKKSCGCGVGERCRECGGDTGPNAAMGGQVPARMG